MFVLTMKNRRTKLIIGLHNTLKKPLSRDDTNVMMTATAYDVAVIN